MTDATQTTSDSSPAGATSMGAADPGAGSPLAGAQAWVQAWREGDVVGPPDKPEVAVGAAFAGGLLVALILKRLGN